MTWTLHHGDALRWLETLLDGSADALITDPPYSSGGLQSANRNSTPSKKYIDGSGRYITFCDFEGDTRDQRVHSRWMVDWLSEARRVLRIGAPVCLFSDWRQLPLTTDAMQYAGFIWRGIMVWDKTNCRFVRGRPQARAEYIVWGSKGDLPLTRNAPALPGIFTHAIARTDRHHMTGKPTALMRRLVNICERHSDGSGGLILDPFAGSGTTLVAAALEGYRAAGCELSEDYY